MAGDVRSAGTPGGAVPPATPPAGGARPLVQTLVPGSVLSGRVVQGLGQDLYLLALRGRTLVAESSLPLAADTMVKVQVMGSGDQLSLRLLDARGADQATTSDAPARAQTLGLPLDSAAQAVLAAFEDAGAPLDRDLLRTAISAVVAQGAAAETAPETSGAGAEPATGSAALLEGATPTELAKAYATVARSGLPATPATLALALRATAAPLPNPAAALTRALAAEAAVTASGDAPAPGTGDRNAAPAAVGLPPRTDAGARTAPADPTAPSGRPAPATTTTATPVTPATRPDAGRPSAPAIPVLVAATIGADRPHPAATPSPASDRPAQPTPGPTRAQGGTVPPAAPATTATMPAVALAARLVPAVPLSIATIPDAVREGAAGVMRALSLAGVRSAASSAPATPAGDAQPVDTALPPPTALPAPLLRQLAAALPRPDDAASDDEDQVRGIAADPGPGPTAALAGALVHTAHEQAAQTVFKPDSLADYRLVLSLPLQADGQPTPARLAIGERPGPDGTTTYLRVDTELSDLGTVSVRLAGTDGGPLTITLIGRDAGSRALEEALPGLVASLRDLGLSAGVRVVDGDPD